MKMLDKFNTKIVKNSDFLSILYSMPQREYEKKYIFKVRDIVRVSKYDWPFSKS